jgi:hypothetical protein
LCEGRTGTTLACSSSFGGPFFEILSWELAGGERDESIERYLRQIVGADRLGKDLVTVKTQRLEDKVATLEEAMARLKGSLQ